MPLVTPKEIYSLISGEKAMAVGGFNVHNMEYTQAVVKAAEVERMPVILMLGEPMLEYANLDMLVTITTFAAKNSRIPIAVILDHGKTFKNIQRCIDIGISIMVDGSHLPFEENIRFTKDAVIYAKRTGASVEGELGSLAGIEDIDKGSTEHLTDPEKAVEFVERTGIDSLAVSIGNQHGKYIGKPILDIERLRKIKNLVNIPLVLHGGSDLPVNLSIEAINSGITKFNIGTDLKYAFCEELKRVLNKEPMPFQPPQTLGLARENVYRVAREKIQLFKNGNELNLF